MIDFLSAEEQVRWIAELNGHILQCVKDANGNHVSQFADKSSVLIAHGVHIQVIQKFLESPLSDRSFFIATFKNHVYELATHAYGCRVLQRCFEHVEPDLVRPLLNELHLRTINLMQDQYGVSSTARCPLCWYRCLSSIRTMSYNSFSIKAQCTTAIG
jgi:pumilio RNA-binding family